MTTKRSVMERESRRPRSEEAERAFEHEMASAVRTILLTMPSCRASYAEIREHIPEVVQLTKADRAPSRSRKGERVWYQIVRNLKAHNHKGFVSVPGGLRLSWQAKRAMQEPAVAA